MKLRVRVGGWRWPIFALLGFGCCGWCLLLFFSRCFFPGMFFIGVATCFRGGLGLFLIGVFAASAFACCCSLLFSFWRIWWCCAWFPLLMFLWVAFAICVGDHFCFFLRPLLLFAIFSAIVFSPFSFLVGLGCSLSPGAGGADLLPLFLGCYWLWP